MIIKSLFAENSCDIFITGSNSHILSGDLATFLAGRYIQFTVHPLSYPEFLVFYDAPNTDETLRRYLRIGGMPYLSSISANTSTENLAFEYLRNLYESILLRDVVSEIRGEP